MLIKPIDIKLAKDLAATVLTDMGPQDINELAREALTRRFLRKHTVQSLFEDYGEEYLHIFIENNVNPNTIAPLETND